MNGELNLTLIYFMNYFQLLVTLEVKSPGRMKTNTFSGWRNIWENLEGDRVHVLILFFLYFLQGIPIGLTFAMPLILSNRNVPYAEQAIFSFSAYSFSMKVIFNQTLILVSV